jgi:putative salt-induced outer membrane protein YdiY
MKHGVSFILALILIINFSSTAQINTERYRKDSDSTGISAIADVEITAITGNTGFQFIDLGGRLNYNWGKSYTFLVADAGFGWDDGDRIFNQALVHLRHVYSITELIQSEVFAQTDFNKKRLLTGRELIGGGLRYKLLTENDLKLRFGLSYFYEYEKYDVPISSVHGSNKFANRLSTYLTLEIGIKDDVKFLIVTYIQPQIGKWKDYRIILDSSLKAELSSFVDLKVSFNLRFDAKPPESIKSADTFTRFGFSFKL